MREFAGVEGCSVWGMLEGSTRSPATRSHDSRGLSKAWKGLDSDLQLSGVKVVAGGSRQDLVTNGMTSHKQFISEKAMIQRVENEITKPGAFCQRPTTTNPLHTQTSTTWCRIGQYEPQIPPGFN